MTSKINRKISKKELEEAEVIVISVLKMLNESEINIDNSNTIFIVIELLLKVLSSKEEDDMSLENFDLLVELGQKIPYTPQKRQVYGRINKKYYNGNNEKFLE